VMRPFDEAGEIVYISRFQACFDVRVFSRLKTSNW